MNIFFSAEKQISNFQRKNWFAFGDFVHLQGFLTIWVMVTLFSIHRQQVEKVWRRLLDRISPAHFCANTIFV